MTEVLFAHVKNGVVVNVSVHTRASNSKKGKVEFLQSVDDHMEAIRNPATEEEDPEEQKELKDPPFDYWFEVDPADPVHEGDCVDQNNKRIVSEADIERLREDKRIYIRGEMEQALMTRIDDDLGLDYTDRSLHKLRTAENGIVLTNDKTSVDHVWILNHKIEPVLISKANIQNWYMQIHLKRAEIFKTAREKLDAVAAATTVDAIKALLILFVMVVLAVPVQAASQVGVFIRAYPFSSITSPVAYQTYAFDSATGKLYVYNGSAWVTSAPPFSNYTASAAPTANDDSNDGYVVGSMWFDAVNKNFYAASSVAVGAAVWDLVTGDNVGLNNINKFLVASDLTGDYVGSGVLCTVPSSGLTLISPAGNAYLSSTRTTVPSFTYTYTAASWTYDFIQTNGTVTHTNVATDAGIPGTSGLLFQLVKANATDITSIVPYNTGIRSFFSLIRNTTPYDGLPVAADPTQASGLNFRKIPTTSLSNGSALDGWIILHDGTTWNPSATMPIATLDPTGAGAGQQITFNGSLWAASGPGLPVVPQTSDFTVQPGIIYTVDTTAADVAATLPDATLFTGQTCTIIIIAGGTNDLNVTSVSSQLIQGAASPLVGTAVGTKYTLTSNGFNWY